MSNAVPKMMPANVRLESLELQRMKERTSRLFAAIEEAMESDSPDSYDLFSPAVDICETAERVRIYVELPGVPSDQIDLSVTAKEITIEGEKRPSVNTEKALTHYCCERGYGKFMRRIQLRWSVNIKDSTATLVNGTLEISLPKLKDRRGKPVKIPIVVPE